MLHSYSCNTLFYNSYLLCSPIRKIKVPAADKRASVIYSYDDWFIIVRICNTEFCPELKCLVRTGHCIHVKSLSWCRRSPIEFFSIPWGNNICTSQTRAVVYMRRRGTGRKNHDAEYYEILNKKRIIWFPRSQYIFFLYLISYEFISDTSMLIFKNNIWQSDNCYGKRIF